MMEAFTKFMLGVSALVLADCGRFAFAERPNVLIVLADDLGYSDLGCYGGEIHTPNLDALAGGGVRFSQCYNSARCCPSRASIMTGVYPTQAGIGDFVSEQPDLSRGIGYLGRLRDDCVTLAEVLKPSGYSCYYVGKWHLHTATGPVERGFDEFYGYTRDHSHDQYDSEYYIRLPKGRVKEIAPTSGEFYATDVFNEYALEFLRQGTEKAEPWFLFLAHSSPHFPIQAPRERAERYVPIYREGWDILRDRRFAKIRDLGLASDTSWQLSPRSIVPVDDSSIANGFSGQSNPPWVEIPIARQEDLALRMALFAAMVEGIDRGVGRIVQFLRETHQLENTLILFLSDNGGCYEWGPWGFDGVSRTGHTTLHEGDALRSMGGPGTHHAYGSGWANLSNTPFRMYKHFLHEGGICTPLILHWTNGQESGFLSKSDSPNRSLTQPSTSKSAWVGYPVHVMDLLPTIMEATGTEYPSHSKGVSVTPFEGMSLFPILRGESLSPRSLGFDHQGAHAFRKSNWKIVWSKRMPKGVRWELYDLSKDRCELNDLAEVFPNRVKEMAKEWEEWAARVGVVYPDSNQGKRENANLEIAGQSVVIDVEVESSEPKGVVIAQGGNRNGYAIFFEDGKPCFVVRRAGEIRTLRSDREVEGRSRLHAEIQSNALILAVDDDEPIVDGQGGFILSQPTDGLDIGRDNATAVGEYRTPNAFHGKILQARVATGSSVFEFP